VTGRQASQNSFPSVSMRLQTLSALVVLEFLDLPVAGIRHPSAVLEPGVAIGGAQAYAVVREVKVVSRHLIGRDLLTCEFDSVRAAAADLDAEAPGGGEMLDLDEVDPLQLLPPEVGQRPFESDGPKTGSEALAKRRVHRLARRVSSHGQRILPDERRWHPDRGGNSREGETPERTLRGALERLLLVIGGGGGNGGPGVSRLRS
jgi:hypothetical protein